MFKKIFPPTDGDLQTYLTEARSAAGRTLDSVKLAIIESADAEGRVAQKVLTHATVPMLIVES